MDRKCERALGEIRSSTCSQIIAHHFLVFQQNPILSRSNGEALPSPFETIPILIYFTLTKSRLLPTFVSIALPTLYRSVESLLRELICQESVKSSVRPMLNRFARLMSLRPASFGLHSRRLDGLISNG